MHARWLMIPLTGLAAAAAGCDRIAPQPGALASADHVSPPALGKVAAEPPAGGEAAAFKPWKQEADCYWVMTYPDGVAHRATISGGTETGVFLTIVDSDLFDPWPIDDRIKLSLRFDGDPDKTIETLGNHAGDDSSSVLALILEKPARALIPSSSRLELLKNGQTVLELPMAGNPTAPELEACDPAPGPGEFVEP